MTKRVTIAIDAPNLPPFLNREVVYCAFIPSLLKAVQTGWRIARRGKWRKVEMV